MSATVVFDGYGGPEVLHVVDTPVPQPGPSQVLIRVRAAGVQPADTYLRSGRFRQNAAATFPQRLGNEFAGLVEAAGDGATEWSTGDEVIGWVTAAAYAQHVVVEQTDLATKPPELPWPEAGVLSASGQTAASVLTQLAVGPGDVLLIHGAAGGVGSYAVQLAAARGATVIGTASDRNHEYLRGLGATPVAYGDGLAERVREVTQGVDVALDCSGTVAALTASVELVADRDRIATIAYQPAADELGVRRLGTRRSAYQLRDLALMAAAGRLRVEIQARYPLAEAAQAHRDIETGHVRGKVVLLP
jgi:enoyl reductase